MKIEKNIVGKVLLAVCAGTILNFQLSVLNSQLSTLNSLHAQNYSTADTTTEYPNKGTYYHDKFEGRKTASGEVFDQNAFTAAHWCIKLGTHILVTNQNTGLQVIVKVNDRCPRHGVIDMSHRAATAIGIRGCQPVTVRLLPEGYEERCLAQDARFDSVRSPRYPHLPTALDVIDANKAKSIQSAEAVVQHPKEELYNLILCNVTNHGEAYGSIGKLPEKYQDKALVEVVGGSSDLRVSLDVRMTRQQADDLCRTLAAIFPRATVIPVPED